MTVTDSISRHAASSLSRPGGKIKSWLPHCWHFHWFHLGDLKFFLCYIDLPKPQASERLSESLLHLVSSCYI